jgi:hypothetical protein
MIYDSGGEIQLLKDREVNIRIHIFLFISYIEARLRVLNESNEKRLGFIYERRRNEPLADNAYQNDMLLFYSSDEDIEH